MAERLTSVRGVDIVYETFGEASGLPLLLIMGLGGQMIWWEDEFCNQLVDAGFFVIRFDDRDSGRSQDIDAAPRAFAQRLAAQQARLHPRRHGPRRRRGNRRGWTRLGAHHGCIDGVNDRA
jgi:pimeloyl-ACP methyl ester carboxylesterase